MEGYQDTLQWIAVGLCVVGALFFLARGTYLRLAGKSEKGCGGCGGCGGGCGDKTDQKADTPQLMQIDIKKKISTP